MAEFDNFWNNWNSNFDHYFVPNLLKKNKNQNGNLKKLTYKQISMILYGIALFTPIFFGDWIVGFFGLLLGVIGIFEMEPFLGLPWIANFLYFGNLLFKKGSPKLKIGISITTIIFGLFAIGIREVPVHEGGLNNEVVVGIGFLIWISSFIVLLIGQLKEKNKNVG